MNRSLLYRYLFNCLIMLIILSMSACSEVNIPIIKIKKSGSISGTTKDPCKVLYSYDDENILLNGKIKRRGGMSRKYEKHSYALEFDCKVSIGGLPSDDDWILNANYIDKTFMRHKISYDLFNDMNINNIAPACSYVNIYLNDLDQGLYVLMEKINGSMVGLSKKDPYAMLFKDPPIFYKEKLPNVQDPSNYYQQKYPKLKISDQTAYIEEFKSFIFYAPDSVFISDIIEWVDIDNIVDWHLLLLFSNNSDGIMKNFYLYKLDNKTPFRIAIWDYDHSYGRDGDNELNMIRPLDVKRSILLKRLLELEEIGYINKLRNRWEEHKKNNILSVNGFKKRIQKNNSIITPLIKKNNSIWPNDAHWYFDDNDYQKEVNLLIEYVQLRTKQIDDYFGLN